MITMTPQTLEAPAPRWMDLVRAARYVDLSTKTLMKYVRLGVIYGTRKGGKWILDRESIDSWLEEDKIRMLRQGRRRVR